MGKDGKRDERKARRARKAEKQMNRRLHEKEAGQRKQSKRRKHSTASSAVLEISFRSQGVLCGFVLKNPTGYYKLHDGSWDLDIFNDYLFSFFLSRRSPPPTCA